MQMKFSPYVVAAVLVVFWLLGLRMHFGAYAHLFLLPAMVIVIVKAVQGRPGEL